MMRLPGRTEGLLSALALAIVLGGRPAPAEDRYMIVDLTTGEVSTQPEAPGDLLTNAAYKTTKMVLRRIPAGTVKMNGGQLEVRLTLDYYLGVFECTQAQWEAVMDGNPSRHKGPHRPVESVAWAGERRGATVRGGAWPGGQPSDESFLGRMRAKCGGRWAFDLPTEAQWEHACRAGTQTELSSGKDLGGDLVSPNVAEVGRYFHNRDDGKGGHTEHTAVGSYLPNAWGLYDMHGNVWEWCLDWWWRLPTGAVEDYEGHPGEVGGRVLRGGAWSNAAWFCVVEARDEGSPQWCYSSSVGFRVCAPAQAAAVGPAQGVE